MIAIGNRYAESRFGGWTIFAGWKGGGWEEDMDKLSGTRGRKSPLSWKKCQSKNREIER